MISYLIEPLFLIDLSDSQTGAKSISDHFTLLTSLFTFGTAVRPWEAGSWAAIRETDPLFTWLFSGLENPVSILLWRLCLFPNSSHEWSYYHQLKNCMFYSKAKSDERPLILSLQLRCVCEWSQAISLPTPTYLWWRYVPTVRPSSSPDSVPPLPTLGISSAYRDPWLWKRCPLYLSLTSPVLASFKSVIVHCLDLLFLLYLLWKIVLKNHKLLTGRIATQKRSK